MREDIGTMSDPPHEHTVTCPYRREQGRDLCDCGQSDRTRRYIYDRMKKASGVQEDIVMPFTTGKVDLINQPPHYALLTPEPITVIESWHLGFHLGNAVKYIARAGKKEGAPILQDLAKAAWYLNREIVRLKIEEREKS